MRRSERGFSFIEVMVVAAILSILVSLVFAVLKTTSDMGDVAVITSDAETRGRRTADDIRIELALAKLNYNDIAANGTRVRYQVSNKTGAQVYGYYDSTGTFQAGWSAAIEFNALRILKEANATVVSSLPIEQYLTSLNSNNNSTDAFYVGKIVKEIYNSNAVPAPTPVTTINMCDDYVLLSYSSYNGDVYGAGTNDPLLQFLDVQGNVQVSAQAVTKAVLVTVWIGRFSRDHQHFFMRKNMQKIHLTNPQ